MHLLVAVQSRTNKLNNKKTELRLRREMRNEKLIRTMRENLSETEEL